jgi:glycosyltransferase involved in cell wall biosynthesis
MTQQTQSAVSVLIPVFNWDVSLLARSLLVEIESEQLGNQVEIILADDCSTAMEIQTTNRTLFNAPHAVCIRYLELKRNLGRAAIRNFLVAQSTGEFLLFLDADVAPDNSDFLRRYLGYARANSCDVVCGGISYTQRILTGPEYDFYVYMSSRADVHPPAVRNRLPWRWILTSNIMVRRTAFEATPFDQRFIGYGYEDIEWGIRLTRQFRILHIDNPVSHLGLVRRSSVLGKMRVSIPNYHLLATLHPGEFEQTQISSFVRMLRWLPAWVLRGLDCAAVWALEALDCMHPLALTLIQFDKAVLLALAFRRSTNCVSPRIP